MTRGEIARRIAAGINDPEQVFMTPDDLALSIDEAAEVMAEELGAVRRTLFVEQRPGTIYYTLYALGPDLIAPFRIWDQAQSYRLVATSMRELDERMRNWPTSSGVPLWWFPVSWDVFGIWPHPAVGGGTLRVDCYAWPRSLMDDDDSPEMMAGDQDGLVAYGMYEGLVKRLDADKAMESWQEYQMRRGAGAAKKGVVMQAKSWQRQTG